MKITQQQIVNPGAIDASEKRKKQFKRFTEAVNRAKFLSVKEKRHWILLGYILTSTQLLEAEHSIINEDLRVLKMKYNLEKIKSKINKNV